MAASSVFELVLQSTTTEGEYRLVAEWAPPGGLAIRRERSVRLDDATLDAMGDAFRYGAMLGKTIFADGVRELFAQARHEDTMLRVLLAVEAKAAQSLRWERLAAPFDDDQWQLLGQSQRTPFSQYLPSTSDRMFAPFGRRELRALVVVANPEPGNQYGIDPFDEAEALRTALAGLGEIPSVVLGKDARAAGPPTLTEICTRLTAERFTLLHVVCHGAYSPRTGETALFLAGESDGKAVAVKTTAMLQRLRELGGVKGLPHLAFLGVCDSARSEAEAVLGGLGQRLVRELGMPAVVAMTERVSQATAFSLGQVLYARLRDHGEVDRALAEACVEVHSRGDAVVPALFSRLAGRPLFSDDLDRTPTHAEVAAAADRLERLFVERAPVVRERAMELGITVRADPATLADAAAHERLVALAELEQLCEDVLELSFSALAHGREPPPYDVSCPFPGLRAFSADQRRFFRGRGVLVDALLDQLAHEPFLAVIGSSGCGKSSLVLAGVLPRLCDADPQLKVARLEPGDHPLAKLESALAQLEGAAASVIYVDQFEEAFTLCRDEPERRAFFDRLLAAVSPQRKVIMSMRADFLGECAAHEALRRRVEGLRLVPPMSADELRNAIEEQGKAAGLRYEMGLCELILEDVEDEPGAMPLLQHALRELYEQRHGRWLRRRAYDELGRVQKAIGRTAEAVWARLEPRDRERLRMVLLHLTEIREAEDGGPVRYFRRRVPLEHVYATSQSETAELERLVDLLADERLLVKSRDDKVGDVVEVAHEALLRSWDRLQAWLMAGLDALRLRQELESAASGWRSHDHAPAYLEHLRERGELVRSFLQAGTLMLDPGLKEYFEACEAEGNRQARDKERLQQEKLADMEARATAESRRVRQLWIGAAVITALLVAAIAAAVYAVRAAALAEDAGQQAAAATQEAERQRAKAEASAEVAEGAKAEATRERDRARSAAKLAYARALANEDPTLALLVLRAVDAKDTPEWRETMLSALHRPITTAILRHEQPVRSASFNPDGTLILTASKNDLARIWDASGQHEPRLLRAYGLVVDASFGGPAGSLVATVSNDAILRIGDVQGREAPRELGSHESEVTSVSLDRDGKRIVTGSGGGVADLWSVDGSEIHRELLGHRRAVEWVSFSPDGTRLATASADGSVCVWDAATARPLTVLSGHFDTVGFVSFSPDGRKLATASTDFTARIWNTDSGESLAVLQHENIVYAASFSPDGKRVVTASEDGAARLWSASGKGTPQLLRGHGDAVLDARFDPSGQRVVTASRDATVRVWSVDGRNLPKTIDASTVSFDPRRKSSDGKRELIVIEHEVEIRSLDGEGPPRVLEGHEATVLSANFSVDGARVVTASLDGTVRVWDAEGRMVLVLRGSGGAIARASFGADGRSVVIMQGDDPTKAYEWPIETDALEQLAEAATSVCLPVAARVEYLDELPEPACQAFAACERAHGRAGDCSLPSPAASAPRAP